MTSDHHILLVNPFSSARYLSDELKKYSILTTALYTVDMSKIPSYIRPPADVFDEQVLFPSDNVQEIIKYLGSRQFDLVINGYDVSVEITDKLAVYYTPRYANDPNSSKLRSNKYEMHQILAKKNLAHIRQFLYTRNTPLPDLSKLGFNYPCFVKPLIAAASIGACKLNTKTELEKYFSDSFSVANMFETKYSHDKFLIAELIEGDELLVDTFSVNGAHYISSIQKYHKEFFKSGPLYCFWDVVQDATIIKKVSDYVFQVLNATEFNNGFAHTEVFLTQNGEIKLIEINPRISGAGGVINQLARLNDKPSQIDLLVKHIFNIEFHLDTADNAILRVLVLFNFGGHPLYNLHTQLQRWDSVYEVKQLIPDGGYIQSSGIPALTDAIAFVIIRAHDAAIIEQHTKEILAQDKLGWTLV